MSSLTLWIIAVSAAGAAVLFGLVALGLARPNAAAEVAEPQPQPQPQEPVPVAAPVQSPEVDRLRNVAGFAAVIELGDLCARVLRVAIDAVGAEAGAVAVDCPEPAPSVVESSGLTIGEIAWLGTSLHAHNDSSVITRYLYERTTWLDERFVTAVLVPLRDSEGEPIGNLAALWRVDLADEAEGRLRSLEAVAADASAALTNAVRFHQVSALSIRDTETGLLNRRYFAGRLDAEVERAQRSGAHLTLLLAALDGSRGASPVVDGQLVELAELIRGELSINDEVCRVGLAELAALVPRSAAGVQPALEQIRRRLAESGNGIVVSAFELDYGEDSATFFERAKTAAAREVRQPTGTVKLTAS
jgi:GGDEF domain-containing protein